MEHWRSRISHCSWCSRRRQAGREGGSEDTAAGVKGRPHNLVVNPTLGSEAAWEPFTDTGCGDVSEAKCPVLVSLK